LKPRQRAVKPAGMNVSSREAAAEVLEHMQDWLGLSESTYKAAVMLFALRLPPEKLIEAFWLAQCRKPNGGLDGFKYFCGICHSMRRELGGINSRN
jgi:hypothetical protein